MFVQDHYAITDADHVRAVIRDHPWATLVTGTRGELRASHLPCLLDPRHDGSGVDDLVVLGHLARGDPQCAELGHGRDLLLVFQGPHGYLPAAWHETPGRSVGTWNFQAVHLHGAAEVLTGADSLDLLRLTFEHLERRRADPLPWASISSLAEQLVRGTCCFRLPARAVEAKGKLSQDKPLAVRERLITALRRPGPYRHDGLASAMQRELDLGDGATVPSPQSERGGDGVAR